MSYDIFLSQTADNFLNKIETVTAHRIRTKIALLKENPELGKPLVGRLKGLWSLRIGDYRAVYEIEHNKLYVFVIQVGHRKNIYEN